MRPVFVVHSGMAHHLERKPFTQPPPNNFSNLPTTMLQPRLNHPSCRIQGLAHKLKLETTETTCKNNILFLAAKPRGVLESAGVLPAVEVVLSVVNVVSFMTKPPLNHKTARRICRAPRFSHNRVVGSHTAMRTGRRTSPNGELPPRRWSR